MRAELGGPQRHHRIYGGRRIDEYMIHAIEPEVAHEPLKSRLHTSEIQVVTNPVLERCARHPRLRRVHLPRMEIKDARTSFVAIYATEAALEQGVWQQSEITPSAARPIASREADRRHRNFEQARVPWIERKPRCFGHPVQVMANRNHARAVAVAGFTQLLMGPKRSRANRLSGSAIAFHRFAGDVLHHMLGARDAVSTFAAADGGDTPVPETMARQLMPAGSHVTDQRAEPLGYPAEYQE